MDQRKGSTQLQETITVHLCFARCTKASSPIFKLNLGCAECVFFVTRTITVLVSTTRVIQPKPMLGHGKILVVDLHRLHSPAIRRLSTQRDFRQVCTCIHFIEHESFLFIPLETIQRSIHCVVISKLEVEIPTTSSISYIHAFEYNCGSLWWCPELNVIIAGPAIIDHAGAWFIQPKSILRHWKIMPIDTQGSDSPAIGGVRLKSDICQVCTLVHILQLETRHLILLKIVHLDVVKGSVPHIIISKFDVEIPITVRMRHTKSFEGKPM